MAAVPLARAFASPALTDLTEMFLRVLPWLLLPLALSSVLGLLWLVPRRLENQFNVCIGFGAAASVILLLTLSSWIGAVGAAWALLAGECCVTLAMFTIYARFPEK